MPEDEDWRARTMRGLIWRSNVDVAEPARRCEESNEPLRPSKSGVRRPSGIAFSHSDGDTLPSGSELGSTPSDCRRRCLIEVDAGGSIAPTAEGDAARSPPSTSSSAGWIGCQLSRLSRTGAIAPEPPGRTCMRCWLPRFFCPLIRRGDSEEERVCSPAADNPRCSEVLRGRKDGSSDARRLDVTAGRVMSAAAWPRSPKTSRGSLRR